MKKSSVITLSAVLLSAPVMHTNAMTYNLSDSGILLYHNYSSYSAMDSSIHCYNLSSGDITDICSDTFCNPMNADFGSHPYDMIFMAIDKSADEWDIYRYNALTGDITNLTYLSGFRNEDPKFSPDGKKIIFKRGYWNHGINDFEYNLAELDLDTSDITMLTDDIYEQSMPYYSSDGSKIYYALSYDDDSYIYELQRSTSVSSPVFSEKNSYAYYPVTSDSDLYFTKWHSPDNHNDSIVKLNNGNITVLPFNNDNFNCSDPFPLSQNAMFYSSTQNGSYDIFFYDGNTSYEISTINTGLNELGSSFFSYNEIKNVILNTTDFLLGKSYNDINMDADNNNHISISDLISFKSLCC